MSETAKITLPELKPHQCKFPVEENHAVIGGFLFCGHRRIGDSSYCERHFRIAYTSAAARSAIVAKRIASR